MLNTPRLLVSHAYSRDYVRSLEEAPLRDRDASRRWFTTPRIVNLLRGAVQCDRDTR